MSDIADECAACGKEGGDGVKLKKCTACKMVQYCGVACQKAHRSSHKKDDKKCAAELHDEALFEQPEVEDCPICYLPIVIGVIDAAYHNCCGKTICCGCSYADMKQRVVENRTRSLGNIAPLPICCPFCRERIGAVSSKESLRRIARRMELNDAGAFNRFGWWNQNGSHGLTPDMKKAFHLWLKASDLGSTEAHHNVSIAYFEGMGVEKDTAKANMYMKKAAMGGDMVSRYNLGTFEQARNNLDRALRHWMIAAKAGMDDSLDAIGILFRMGHASKADYETALRAHKRATDEMKSEQRDEAAAATQGNSRLPPVSFSE